MRSRNRSLGLIGWLLSAWLGSMLLSWADLNPEWTTRIPSTSPDQLTGMVVDANGVAYIVGNTGPSGSRSLRAAAINPDGTIRWSRVLGNGTAGGVAIGADGAVYITGSVPGAGGYSNLLLLKCDANTGNLLSTYQYSSGAGISEAGASVALDAQGNLYIAGSTVGDGTDVLLLKLNASLQLQWVRTWDGNALAPYSQDNLVQTLLDPSGNPVLLVHAVMADNQPNYMAIKYGADGSILWQSSWGTRASESPRKMVMDANGDFYITGIALNVTLQRATVKMRGTDGQILWVQYDDSPSAIDRGASIALDGQGGVYATGASDPEGNESNFNDNFYTTKREASTGVPLVWSHFYGQNCVGCHDVPADILVDSAGHVFVVGQTSSPPYTNDMILFMLNAQNGIEQERGVVDGGALWRVLPRFLRLDARENLYVGVEFNNVNTGATEIGVIKYRSLVRRPGDVDGNGCVDDADLLQVLFAFGQSGSGMPEDVNNDGIVDDADLLLVLFNFGGGC